MQIGITIRVIRLRFESKNEKQAMANKTDGRAMARQKKMLCQDRKARRRIMLKNTKMAIESNTRSRTKDFSI